MESADTILMQYYTILIKHILQVGRTFIMKIKSNTTNKDLP